MKNIIRAEFYKILNTKRFWICLIIGIFIVFFNTLYISDGYQEFLKSNKELLEFYPNADPQMISQSLYGRWIGAEGFTLSSGVFFFVFPLLIAIPYGNSMYSDLKSGYIKNIAIRTDREKYINAKYIMVFFSGGSVMVIPLFINFIMDAMILPALRPDPRYPYFAILDSCFLSDMYCESPLLYVGIYMVLIFIYCGMLATMSFLCNFFTKSKTTSLVLPYGIILILHYISNYISKVWEWSPLYCIHPTMIRRYPSGVVILTYIILMMMITIFVFGIKRKEKYEIY